MAREETAQHSLGVLKRASVGSSKAHNNDNDKTTNSRNESRRQTTSFAAVTLPHIFVAFPDLNIYIYTEACERGERGKIEKVGAARALPRIARVPTAQPSSRDKHTT